MIKGASCVEGLGGMFEKNAMVKEAALPLVGAAIGAVGRGLLGAGRHLFGAAGKGMMQAGKAVQGMSKMNPGQMSVGGALKGAKNVAKGAWDWNNKQFGHMMGGAKTMYQGMRQGNMGMVRGGAQRFGVGAGKTMAASAAIDAALPSSTPQPTQGQMYMQY